MAENLKKVHYGNLLNEVEAVFAKDAVKDIVSVVRVRDALHEELDRCQNGHVKRKEKPCVWQNVT